MDVNRIAYWILMVGTVVSILFLALSFASSILGLNQFPSITMAAVGVGALIATPYARVMAMAIVSVFNRDRGLFIVSTLVLSVMVLSLLFGLIYHITPKG